MVHHLARTSGEPRPLIDLFQLARFRDQAPPETTDTTVFPRVHWVGAPGLDIGADLANLREPMVDLARAAIFIGGKTTGFQGGKPGIRDEFERFRARQPDAPVYLVGGTGGETAQLVEDANGQDWEKNGLKGEPRVILHTSRDGSIVAALIARDLERYRG